MKTNGDMAPAEAAARPRILCVDDEPQVLEALSQTLRRRFDVRTAGSAAQGLRRLAEEGPFAVVLSDFAMPRMNGAEFLMQARLIAPATVRMLLTGHATLENAIDAVNRGNIFRFLTKPCPPTDLMNALEDAVDHARLLTADRALLQRQLDIMSAQLVRVERLATLGTMAAAVAHELSNVSMMFEGVRSGIQRAVATGTLPSEAHMNALGEIRDRLTLHARHLMLLGRPSRKGAEPRADLRLVVNQVFENLRLAGMLRRVKVEMEIAPEPLIVGLGSAEIEQMLINLTKNAVDALEAARHAAPVIRVSAARGSAPGTAVFAVTDNAAGIAESRLASLFEPYYTTKAPDEGTGLGLFVVRQIARAAGGDVVVDSAVGRGSTFSVVLPLAERSSVRVPT